MDNLTYLSESDVEDVSLMVVEKVVYSALIKLRGKAYDALEVRDIISGLRDGANTLDIDEKLVDLVEALEAIDVLQIFHVGSMFLRVGAAPNAPKFLKNLECVIDTCGRDLVKGV